MKPGAILAVLFLALALISFAFYLLLPHIIAFLMGVSSADVYCPDQQSQPPDCGSEPRAECLMDSTHYLCTDARQFLSGCTILCLFIAAILTVYHVLFETKIRSGSARP